MPAGPDTGTGTGTAPVVHGVPPMLPLRRYSSGGTGEPYRLFAVEPCTPTIGAEISGLDLAAPLTAPQLAELRRALLEWKVLFFRDQQLDARRHADFARLWGTPQIHPFLPKGEVEEVVRLAHDAENPGTENVWHIDVTFSARPPMGSILRAVEVPEVGGDTLWADAGAIYDGLPGELRTRIDGLTALHELPLAPNRKATGDIATLRARLRPVEHPVVRTHPETGRRTLFVHAAFTSRIVGLPEAESRALLDHLFALARYPEYQVRLRWRPGTVAFWDNRAVLHYAVADYHPHARVMERVTIEGDRPI